MLPPNAQAGLWFSSGVRELAFSHFDLGVQSRWSNQSVFNTTCMGRECAAQAGHGAMTWHSAILKTVDFVMSKLESDCNVT